MEEGDNGRVVASGNVDRTGDSWKGGEDDDAT